MAQVLGHKEGAVKKVKEDVSVKVMSQPGPK